MTEHRMTLHTILTPDHRSKFWGTCSCGEWKSNIVPAAGMVHGAFAVHRYSEPPDAKPD